MLPKVCAWITVITFTKIYWILPMDSNVTIKNVSWPHFSWASLYLHWRFHLHDALTSKTGCRVSEETGAGNSCRKLRTSSTHREKDADYNAGKLFLSSAVQRGRTDWTYEQVCRACSASGWKQEPRLQEFTVQDHRPLGQLSTSSEFTYKCSEQFNSNL